MNPTAYIHQPTTATAMRLLAALLLALAPAMAVVARARGVFALPDNTFYARYPFIRFIADGDTALTDDELFFNDAGSVVFPVNRYTLPESDSLLTEFVEHVVPQIHRDSLHLLHIRLRGAASPEGPEANNRRLSERRSQVLYDFLVSQLGAATPDLISQEMEAEDYHMLLQLMQRAGDPDHALVARWCDRYLPARQYAQLKRQLQRARGGELWQKLLRRYFPQLRASRFMLFFRKPEAPATPPATPPATAVVVADTMPVEQVPAAVPDTAPQRLARRELLAVKTNLLLYGVYMPGGYDRWCPIPNVAIEYYPRRGHFTVGASMDFPWWIDYGRHKFFEVRNYQVEGRYYLRTSSDVEPGTGAAFRGFYVLAYLHGGLFEIGFTADKGWRGHGMGGGVGVGYVLPLGRRGHWRLDFGVQVGYLRCAYDPFQFENPINANYHDDLYYYKWTGRPEDFRALQHRFNWFGPTRAGITLSYDLLYRRRQKGGISFRHNEPQPATTTNP
ncbi:MAG: DUF3575 domain-containing protein [Bacteroidaceae bacterium]|nr:DUF3575 domain-containing protein [Bacteroidaceae bacterium]